MTAPGEGSSRRADLRLALAAAGLDAGDERLEELLPGYEALRAGAERARALDLGETEPAVVFRLPAPGEGHAGQ